VSASFTVISPTTIQATVPPAATTGPISLTTAGGTATSASGFTVSRPDIAFIQANGSVPQSPQTVISVPYVGQQTAGNLNVVVIGASDATAQVQSVTDTKNNSYVRAAGPSVRPSGQSLSIYYAANVGTAAAGANIVRVAFTGPAQFPDIRIAEYAGIDPLNPVDAVAAAQGNSGTTNSGALTTTRGNDLLIAANQVATWTSSAGPGYTSRLITDPNGDILEDRVVTASGSYNATASLGAPGDWIMQLVAFRGAAPSSGPVAAYAFSEGSGTTVADASGKGHTGTISGASWTTVGKYGKALSFNGTTSYVDLGNAADLQITGSMTWSAWIFATANPADDGQIISKSSGPGWQLKTSPDTGPHTFGIGISADGSSLTQRYSTTVRALNTWYHVAGVYDAAARTLNIYVNGVLDNGVLVGTVPASQYNSPENVNIGRRSGGYYFQGTIDEVRIYNRALSQAEIQADMNAAIGGP
jgi:concanavalin A-like lectin/glucanase superfamily protein